jgi:hypothetical protein
MIVLDHNEVASKTDDLLRCEEIIQKKLIAIAQKTATDIWDIGEQLSNINEIYKKDNKTIKDWLKEKEEEIGEQLIKPSSAYNWIKIYQSLPRDFMTEWQGAIHTLIAIFTLPEKEQQRLLTEGKERVISGKEVTELKNSLKSPKAQKIPDLDLNNKVGFWVVTRGEKVAKIAQVNLQSVCLEGFDIAVDFSEIKEVLVPNWKDHERLNPLSDFFAESYKEWDIYLYCPEKGEVNGAVICYNDEKLYQFAFHYSIDDIDWFISQSKIKIDELTKTVQEILEKTAPNGNRGGHLHAIDKSQIKMPQHPDFEKYNVGDFVKKNGDDFVWEIINKKPESVSLKNDSEEIEINVSYSILSHWKPPQLEETDSTIWNPLSKELMASISDFKDFKLLTLADDWSNQRALLIPRKTEINDYVDVITQYLENMGLAAIAVFPSQTDSEWFHDWAENFPILFLKESPNILIFFDCCDRVDREEVEDLFADYGVIF